jgi:putative tricarboxylic transport membrane protein
MLQEKAAKKKRIDISILFFIILSVGICFESYKLGLGGLRAPRPGFFPFLTGVLLGGLALVRLAIDMNARGTWEWMKVVLPWKRELPVITGLFIYAVLMPFLGFLLATFLFVFFLLKWTGSRPWVTAGLTSLVVALLVHLLFRVWLQVQLPEGLISF